MLSKQQAFKAVEAYVTLFFEDQYGNQTDEFEVPVWFAKTRHVLIGFERILDRAVLHLDMPNLTGYLEFAR